MSDNSNVIELSDDPRNQRRDVEQVPATESTPLAAGKLPVAVTSSAPLSAAALIKNLRTRLVVVEREIRVRTALEDEREQIKRLLKAAKQEKATVHALKRVAG